MTGDAETAYPGGPVHTEGQSTAMVDGESIAVSTTEQVQPLIEEARLARVQAKEAVQRIQQRIERLEALSEALDCSKGE